jgi:hypothetical protein
MANLLPAIGGIGIGAASLTGEINTLSQLQEHQRSRVAMEGVQQKRLAYEGQRVQMDRQAQDLQEKQFKIAQDKADRDEKAWKEGETYLDVDAELTQMKYPDAAKKMILDRAARQGLLDDVKGTKMAKKKNVKPFFEGIQKDPHFEYALESTLFEDTKAQRDQLIVKISESMEKGKYKEEDQAKDQKALNDFRIKIAGQAAFLKSLQSKTETEKEKQAAIQDREIAVAKEKGAQDRQTYKEEIAPLRKALEGMKDASKEKVADKKPGGKAAQHKPTFKQVANPASSTGWSWKDVNDKEGEFLDDAPPPSSAGGNFNALLDKIANAEKPGQSIPTKVVEGIKDLARKFGFGQATAEEIARSKGYSLGGEAKSH